MAQQDTHEYPFFSHRTCEYFPCHEGIDPDDFNCLFCYCPLYTLGPECGGNYSYTSKGVKDCTACTLPHEGDMGTRHVKEKFPLLTKMAEDDPPCVS